MRTFKVIWENKFGNYSLYRDGEHGLYSLFRGDSLVAIGPDRYELVQHYITK